MVTYELKRFRNLTLDEALRKIKETNGEYDFITIGKDDISRKKNPTIVKLFDSSFVEGFEEVQLIIGRKESRKIIWPVSREVKRATLEEFRQLFGEYPSYHQVMSYESSAIYDRIINMGIERLRIILRNEIAARSREPWMPSDYEFI